MMLRRLLVIAGVVLVTYQAGGSREARADEKALRPDVEASLAGAIRYLEQTQKKETSGTDYFSGEWPSDMRSVRWIPLIGKGGTGGYDSNAFTVGSIHNILASIWERNPELNSIPPMLDLSMERILSYRNGDSFNFWPVLKPDLYQAPSNMDGKVRGPNHFPIKFALLEAGCNVYNDADDTAVSFVAMKNYSKVRPEKVELLKSVAPVFSSYRDTNRHVEHYYNFINGTPMNTGAFMTWLEPEHPLNLLSYVPSLSRIYLPFGMNDVDCVVNANVLNAIATYGELDSPGVQEACRLIETAFKTGHERVCGVYYPSPYNLHYVTAKAYAAGASCLENAVGMAVADILKRQEADGLWSSDIPGDNVHTSLYALNALLYAGGEEKQGAQAAIDRAVGKLLEVRKDEGGATRWEPGVFFSGGTFSRHWIYWKSDAYTTALAADALSLYLSRLPRVSQFE